MIPAVGELSGGRRVSVGDGSLVGSSVALGVRVGVSGGGSVCVGVRGGVSDGSEVCVGLGATVAVAGIWKGVTVRVWDGVGVISSVPVGAGVVTCGVGVGVSRVAVRVAVAVAVGKGPRLGARLAAINPTQ